MAALPREPSRGEQRTTDFAYVRSFTFASVRNGLELRSRASGSDTMGRISSLCGVAALALLATTDGQVARAQASDDKLGKVHFVTSCNAGAQADFDRAMLYQHSFWYRASQKAFESALAKDPTCAIAWWGIALSLLNNPHAAPPPANLPAGLAAIEKARAAGAKTQREKDFIEALSAIYVDYDKVDHATRVRRYVAAMQQLAERYPDDDEAQLYYGLALN